jgi:hypothetical protein
MPFTISQVDEIVASLSVSELKNKTNITRIIGALGNDPNLMIHFLVSKNIKIFGGIDLYVDDYLTKLNTSVLSPEEKETAMFMLQKILTYDISEERKERIRTFIATKLKYAAARGAGKSRRKKLRRKSKKYAY